MKFVDSQSENMVLPGVLVQILSSLIIARKKNILTAQYEKLYQIH